MRALLCALVGIGTIAALTAACGGTRSPETEPTARAATQVRLAQAYLNAGKLNEATAAVEEALAIEPEDARLHNFKGQLMLLARRHGDAEAALLRALELDPRLTDAHNNLGALYDEMGREDDAERHYLMALDDPAYPTPQKVHLNLGLLYSSQGRREESVGQLRRAVEIDPDYLQAHYELAGVLEALGRLDEAAREYEVAAPDYQQSGEYFLRLGFVYFRLGRSEEAQARLERVAQVAPGSENAARADEILKMIP